jgi:hypothetical protein
MTSPLNLPAPGRRQCVYGALRGLARTCVFAKQSLGPIHCGRAELRARGTSPGAAPLLPKLRGQYAEFLDHVSLDHLRLLASPTCVGLRYGRPRHSPAQLFSRVDSGRLGLPRRAPLALPSRRVVKAPLRGWTADPHGRSPFVPRSLSGCYRASGGAGIFAGSPSPTPLGPRLRARLTPRRSPWRGNPWACGVQGFHLDLRVLIPASSLPSAPPQRPSGRSPKANGSHRGFSAAGNAPLPRSPARVSKKLQAALRRAA